MIKPEFLPADVRQHIEKSLSAVHGTLVAFADRIGGVVSLEHHADPHRAITVTGSDGIVRKIVITPVLRDAKKETQPADWQFSLGIAAWKDDYNTRHSWAEKVALFEDLSQSGKKIQTLLDKCWEKLLQIKESDLSESIARK